MLLVGELALFCFRAIKLPFTAFLASPALRIAESPLAKLLNLNRRRSQAVGVLICGGFAALGFGLATVSLLVFGEHVVGSNGKFAWSELAKHFEMQVLEIAGWAQGLVDRPLFATTALFGALSYLALCAHQLGKAQHMGRVSWPEQVAAADRSTFGGVIIGNGGTGKSTLVDYLYQSYMQSQFVFFRSRDLANLGGAEFVLEYYKSRGGVGGAITPYRVTGTTRAYRVGYRRELVDTPGQAWRYACAEPACDAAKGTSWSKRFAEAMERDDCLIVNVMSWGYGAAIRRPEIYRAYGGAGDGSGFRRNAYLNDTRAFELKALEYAIDQIKGISQSPAGSRYRRLLFVNLVNMAGLWWRQRDDVERYYIRELSPVWDKLRSVRRIEVAPYVPVSLLFDDVTTELPGAGACRTPVFCTVGKDDKQELVTATVVAINALEQSLYGKAFTLPPQAGGDA